MGVTLVRLGALVTMLGVSMTQAQGVHSPVLGAATALRADYTVHSHNKQVSSNWDELSLSFIISRILG